MLHMASRLRSLRENRSPHSSVSELAVTFSIFYRPKQVTDSAQLQRVEKENLLPLDETTYRVSEQTAKKEGLREDLGTSLQSIY